MLSRLLTLLLLVWCCHLVVAGSKKMKVDGKTYTVSAYPEDCTKYLLCSNGRCKVESCKPTYLFDPVKLMCTHHVHRSFDCHIFTG